MEDQLVLDVCLSFMLLTYPCVLIHYLLVNSEEGNYRSAALFSCTTLLDHLTTLAATLVQCGLNYLPVLNRMGYKKWLHNLNHVGRMW